MFEVTIYDERDVNDTHPGSHLGTFENVQDASEAVADYFDKLPQHLPHLLRVEIVKQK